MYGKKVIAEYSKILCGKEYKVVVLDDKDYYNIHVFCCDDFDKDESNTLFVRDSKDYENEIWYDKQDLIGYLMEFFIKHNFYEEGIVIASINIIEIREKK